MKLRDAVKLTIGGGWGEDEVFDASTPVTIVRGADFPDVSLGRFDQLPLRFEGERAAAKRKCQAGDILVEVSGGTRDRPTGRSVFVNRELVEAAAGTTVIPASFCRLMRVDPSMVHPRFVYYSLQRFYASGLAWSYQNQSTGISNFQFPRFLSEFELPDFDLATQTAIADVLGALDDKIAANEREIRLLDELTHALTLAALVRGQRQVGLKDFADLTMGSSPTGATLSEDATGVAFHQGVRDFGIRQPTDRIFTSAPVRMARVGDVLISVRAPVGRLNRAATDLCIGRGLAAARSRHCSGATLYNLLRAAPDLWEAHGSDGTVFSSISRPQLENLPVGVPDELGLLDEQLTVLEARVDVLTAESARLAATRDALLPELMSGRLNVGEVA